MPVFKAVELRALLTCCGLIDSLMLSMPPFDVSSLSITHLINIPGRKMFGSESISCGGTSSEVVSLRVCVHLNTASGLGTSICRPTSESSSSSCLVSCLAYDSQMFLILRKPCRPHGRLTVTSKSVTSFTQPSNSMPTFTSWKNS